MFVYVYPTQGLVQNLVCLSVDKCTTSASYSVILEESLGSGSIMQQSWAVAYSLWTELLTFTHIQCSVVMCKNVIIWCSGPSL